MRTKALVTCLFLMIGASLTAQTKIDDLFGNWKVNSFILNGKKQDASKTYFMFSMSDAGDYTLSQIFETNPRNIVNTATVKELGPNKFIHNYGTSSADDRLDYTFWLSGSYTYSVNGEVITLTGEDRKIELQRK
jgi:hypothetical protein